MTKKLKVLIDINHPAHVHFFKNTITRLLESHHQVLITSREKEFASALLDGLNCQHIKLTSNTKVGMFWLLKELICKDYLLLKVVRKFKPDVMVSVGGTFISHVSFISGIKSLVFYDTEIAKLQNLITYPFCSQLYVPACYSSWVIKNKTKKYNGYHELAYLHPSIFKPSIELAKKSGLVPNGDNYYLRIISWHANHDVGYAGLSMNALDKLISHLSQKGNVIISSEKKIPEKYNRYLYKGDLNNVHHVLAYCKMYIGESATMASESAMLGVPALYIADSYRGYVDDIKEKYGLIRTLSNSIELLEQVSDLDNACEDRWSKAREKLLSDKINVSDYIYSAITE